MLELDNVSTGYDDVQVLWDVSLRVEVGELVSLLGNNGAGKTTTLGAIMGILPLFGGDVRFRGESITEVSVQDRSGLGLTIAPEDDAVFPDMTVKGNLRVSAYGVDKEERRRRLERVYDLFPRLQERTGQYADTLSGGERQMLNIGSALMRDPDMLLIDEPSLGLAPMLADDILSEIENISNQGMTVLLVEQNVNKALSISDRAYVMEKGQIRLEGRAKDLMNDEKVRESYLGI
ncbi:ABC transporter ATP-binding protein [Halomarina halobia]|uniref:ABC transporter ATP-binding protein n=1 Tax=Halomarina halobia TaxID=3033386 RepID=A0ABD6AFF5_9EURY|nr:ABC transporter ATP-binding protein [Halomarina sp. PSR21]